MEPSLLELTLRDTVRNGDIRRRPRVVDAIEDIAKFQ